VDKGLVMAYSIVKLKKEQKKLRQACKLAANCLVMLGKAVKPGLTLLELDKLAYDYIIKHKAIPACLGYHGYPKTLCISINNVLCHGIPDETKLKNGDIVSIDVTVIYKGYHGDTCKTFIVGHTHFANSLLVDAARQITEAGIKVMAPGVSLQDVSRAMLTEAKLLEVNLCPQFAGHGVGRQFHMQPSVLSYLDPKQTDVLVENMVLTVEPIVTYGTGQAVILVDQWTAVSKDGANAAQFEHTVIVTATGYEILTLPRKKRVKSKKTTLQID
jgi:methionyl aminopeptidase